MKGSKTLTSSAPTPLIRRIVTYGAGASQGTMPFGTLQESQEMGQAGEQLGDASEAGATESLAELAGRFVRARAETYALPDDPSLLVATVSDAYEVQSNIVALTGDVRGWKVTALTPGDQAKYRSDRPVAGPLLAPYVMATPAVFVLSQFVAPIIECEIAFVLGADLPPREPPYAQAEVEAMVDAVVPGIEIVDSRIPARATDLLRLADSMANGAYVIGAPVSAWRDLDLTSIPVAFSTDNGDGESGTSARVLGNPFLAVIALANAQPLAGPGLKKGQIITTGTCTPPVPLRKGNYVANFGPLGEIRFSVD
jgi:2-keto-4-pentenoate hydratase